MIWQKQLPFPYDVRSRAFTIRMFSIAITLSFIGTLGVMLKVFGIV